jgi:hypothetical protein
MPMWHRSRPWIFAPIAAVVVVAAGFGIYLVAPPSPATSFNPDAISFFQALDITNRSLTNATHSAWSLVSVLGIESVSPVNPPIVLGDERSCAGLPSPTVWNTSALPVATGRVAPGTAPFWQFTFLNRSSRAWVMATVVDRTPHVLGPLAPWAPCSQVYGVKNTTNLSGYPSIHPKVDTTAVGPLALSTIGTSFLASHPHSATYYTMGNSPLANFGWNAVEWFVSYTECGVSGASVRTPAPLDAAWVNATSGQLDFTFRGGFSCVSSSYVLNLSKGSTSVPTLSLTVCGPSTNGSPPICGSPSGLSSMAIGPAVTTPAGLPVAPSGSLCPTWVRNVSACPNPSSGWYIVLTSPTGEWLDSYPSVTGAGWIAPNVDIETGDLLLIETTSGSTLSGDHFALQGLLSTPVINSNSVVL